MTVDYVFERKLFVYFIIWVSIILSIDSNQSTDVEHYLICSSPRFNWCQPSIMKNLGSYPYIVIISV
jgi:hypothetical protein